MENNLFGIEINNLIIKVLTNVATKEEVIMLQEWIHRSEFNKKYYFQFRAVWIAAYQVNQPNTINTLGALNVVNQKIDSLQSSSSAQESRWSLSQIFTRFSRVAALWMLIFILGATASWFIFRFPDTSQSSGVTFVAPLGSKAITFLPDGSEICLNAGSEIRYYLSDKRQIREVFLSGEAYFEVAKNPDVPFVVYAGALVVKAYGTKFNVKAYSEERVVTATLVEGSISVEVNTKPSNKIILKPNEQVLYYKSTSESNEKLLVSKGIDPILYTSWINDRLQISGETLDALAVKLSRKYGMTINFEDSSLKDLRFTGIIENETIEQVLEMLKISSSVNYRIRNRNIWLMKKENKN
jgi:transmembrane sensor